MKSVLITTGVSTLAGERCMSLGNRGIGEEGFYQHGEEGFSKLREDTDCRKRTAGDKIGTKRSPMNVDTDDNE